MSTVPTGLSADQDLVALDELASGLEQEAVLVSAVAAREEDEADGDDGEHERAERGHPADSPTTPQGRRRTLPVGTQLSVLPFQPSSRSTSPRRRCYPSNMRLRPVVIRTPSRHLTRPQPPHARSGRASAANQRSDWPESPRRAPRREDPLALDHRAAGSPRPGRPEGATSPQPLPGLRFRTRAGGPSDPTSQVKGPPFPEPPLQPTRPNRRLDRGLPVGWLVPRGSGLWHQPASR